MFSHITNHTYDLFRFPTLTPLSRPLEPPPPHIITTTHQPQKLIQYV